MVVIDTNIIIEHLRLRHSKQESSLTSFLKNNLNIQLAISLITIQELYQGKSTQDYTEEVAMTRDLEGLSFLDYTYNIAQLAGELVRDSYQPISFADASIAATALINEAPLFTLNRKHFAGIHDLELIDF